MAKRSLNNDLMNNSNYRNYEWGKCTVINEIASCLHTLNEIDDLDDAERYRKFIKIFMTASKDYIFSHGKSKPTPYELKFNYVTTFKWRKHKIKIFEDTYGQSYYFYFNGRCIGCGTYNSDWEEVVTSVVDDYLDYICDLSEIDKKYSGAHLKYLEYSHNMVGLTYRTDLLKFFDLNEYINSYSIDRNQAIEKIKENSIEILDALFASEEFQKMEEERKASGNLYLQEMMEKDDNI